MNVKELKKRLNSPSCPKLQITSYEGYIYLIELDNSGRHDVLEDERTRKPHIFYNPGEARDFLRHLGAHEAILVHGDVHDEMIGFEPHYKDNEEMQLAMRF